MSNEQKISSFPNLEVRKVTVEGARDRIQRMIDLPGGDDWSAKFQFPQEPKTRREQEAFIIGAAEIDPLIVALSNRTIPALENQLDRLSRLNDLAAKVETIRKSAERRKQGLPGLSEEILAKAEAIFSGFYGRDTREELRSEVVLDDKKPYSADNDPKAEAILPPKKHREKNLSIKLPDGREISGIRGRESQVYSMIVGKRNVSRQKILDKIAELGSKKPLVTFNGALYSLRLKLSAAGGYEINLTDKNDKDVFYSFETAQPSTTPSKDRAQTGIRIPPPSVHGRVETAFRSADNIIPEATAEEEKKI